MNSEQPFSDITVIQTLDGSHTLFVPALNEHYHSTFGAIGESMHIFIRAGLDHFECDELSILEVGFGTGLNALLTCLESWKKGLKICYTAIEPFPLKEPLWRNLNYPSLLGDEQSLNFFERIHSSGWDTDAEIHPGFRLHKIRNTVQQAEFLKQSLQLVYFDAFSPVVQPEMWAEGVFSKLHAAMAPEGILVTYSSKGLVKRALKAAGFRIEKLPGPPGKREFLRAVK